MFHACYFCNFKNFVFWKIKGLLVFLVFFVKLKLFGEFKFCQNMQKGLKCFFQLQTIIFWCIAIYYYNWHIWSWNWHAKKDCFCIFLPKVQSIIDKTAKLFMTKLWPTFSHVQGLILYDLQSWNFLLSLQEKLLWK